MIKRFKITISALLAAALLFTGAGLDTLAQGSADIDASGAEVSSGVPAAPEEDNSAPESDASAEEPDPESAPSSESEPDPESAPDSEGETLPGGDASAPEPEAENAPEEPAPEAESVPEVQVSEPEAESPAQEPPQEEAAAQAEEEAALQPQASLEALLALAETDGAEAARLLNLYSDDEAFGTALRELLVFYYGQAEESPQQALFVAALDARADALAAQFATAAAERATNPTELGYIPGAVLVKYRRWMSEARAEAVTEELDASVEAVLLEVEHSLITRVEIPLWQTVPQAVAAFEADPDVIFAEPDGVVVFDEPPAETEAISPNDTWAAQYRWYHEKLGTLAAWEMLPDNPDNQVIVAVIDQMAKTDHIDLDGLFLEDHVISYQGGVPMEQTVDPVNHATHVAGIIAAKANNASGGYGVASGNATTFNQTVRLMALDVMNETELTGSVSSMVAAINHAANNGASVINMSIGFTNTHRQALTNAINYAADEKDVLIVSSAGNSNEDDARYDTYTKVDTDSGKVVKKYNTGSLHYPSDYTSKVLGVISLANTTYDTASNPKYSTSNYGWRKELAAPGASIYSTGVTNASGNPTNYVLLSGTSMASPMVAGVAALVRYANPALSAQQVADILCATATDLHTPGRDRQTGYGCVNAERAVAMALGLLPTQSLSATQSGTTVQLAWDAVPHAQGYALYATAPGGSRSLVATLGSGATSYAHENQTLSGTYSYELCTVPKQTEVPVEDVTDVRNSTMALSWTGASSEASENGYKVYGTLNSTRSVVATLAKGVTSYKHIYPAASGTYSYEVFAVSETQEETAVEGLDAAFSGLHDKLSWTAAEGAGRYKIYAELNGTRSLLATLGCATSYTHAGVGSGETYSYEVVALPPVSQAPINYNETAGSSTNLTTAPIAIESTPVLATVALSFPVTGITLGATAQLEPGLTLQLSPSFSPSYATNKGVAWSSGSAAVATVNASGLVTAVAPGTAVITATSADGGFTASCTVTVPEIPASGVGLNQLTAALRPGQTLQLEATVVPANAWDKSLAWSSNNEGVATVSSAGLVTAVAPGTVTITATTTSGGHAASCLVTVVVPVQSVGINPAAAQLYPGDTQQLTASVVPANAADSSVSWSSGNTAVATVSASGLVTAVAPGTASITVSTVDGGYTATANITVVPPVTSISVSQSSASVVAGKSLTLSATPLTSDGSSATLVWESSDPTIATVTQHGVVTVHKTGTVTITVTAGNGIQSKITVAAVAKSGKKVSKISVTGMPKSLTSGQQKAVTGKYSPASATGARITYKSSKSSVLSVDKSGLLTAKKPGKATITVSAGGKSKKFTVTVKPPAASAVKLSKSALSLRVGKTAKLTAKLTPSYADNNLTWKSSNTRVATVSSKGVVTARRKGTAVITVKTKKGGKTATCTITVK